MEFRPGCMGTWTGLHGVQFSHLEVQSGGLDPGPERILLFQKPLIRPSPGISKNWVARSLPWIGLNRSGRREKACNDSGTAEVTSSSSLWEWVVPWGGLRNVVIWSCCLCISKSERDAGSPATVDESIHIKGTTNRQNVQTTLRLSKLWYRNPSANSIVLSLWIKEEMEGSHDSLFPSAGLAESKTWSLMATLVVGQYGHRRG